MLSRSPSQEELRKLALESLRRNKNTRDSNANNTNDARSTVEVNDEAEEGEILEQGVNVKTHDNEQINLEKSDDSDFDDLMKKCITDKGNKDKPTEGGRAELTPWQMEDQRLRVKDRKKRRTDARASKPKMIDRSIVTETHSTTHMLSNSNFTIPQIGFSQPMELMYPGLIAPPNLNFPSFVSHSPFHIATPTNNLMGTVSPYIHNDTFPGFSFPATFVPPATPLMENNNVLPTQPFFPQHALEPLLSNFLQAQSGILPGTPLEVPSSYNPQTIIENAAHNHTNGNVPKHGTVQTAIKPTHSQFTQPLIIHVDQLEDSDTDEDHKNASDQQSTLPLVEPAKLQRILVETTQISTNHLSKAKTTEPPRASKRSEIEKLKQIIAQKEQQKKTTINKPKSAKMLDTTSQDQLQLFESNIDIRPSHHGSSPRVESLQFSKISFPELILEDLQHRIDRLKAKISQDEQFLNNCQGEATFTERHLVSEMQFLHDQRTVQTNCLARHQVLTEQITVLEANLRQCKVQESLAIQKLRHQEQEQSERRQNLLSLLSSVDNCKLSLCEMEIEWRIAQDACEVQTGENAINIEAGHNIVDTPFPQAQNVEILQDKENNHNRAPSPKRQKLDAPQETKPHAVMMSPSHRELTCFRSYRLNPNYSERTRQQLSSISFANKIDCSKHLCRFELHGVCNNDECKYIHKKDYSMSDEEILKQLAGYKTQNSSEETKKFVDELIHQLWADQRLSCEDKCVKLMKTLESLNSGKPYYISTFAGNFVPNAHDSLDDFAGVDSSGLLQPPSFLKKYRTSRLTIIDDKPTEGMEAQQNVDDQEEVDDIIFNLANYIPISAKSRSSERFSDLDSADTQFASYYEQKNRYWALQSSQDFEKALSEDTQNIVLWLKWAFTLDPPSKIDGDRLFLTKKARNRITSILSQALEHNKDNLLLLIVFLHFYLTGTSKAEVPSLFKNAFAHATTRSRYPTLLWHMYVQTADSISEKVAICQEAVQHILGFISNNPDPLDWSASGLLVHFILKAAEFQCQSDRADATRYLHDVILDDTYSTFRTKIAASDILQLCLVYIFVTAFCTYPFSGNAVKVSKHPFHPSFIINWSVWLKDVVHLDAIKQVESVMLDILDHFKTFDIADFIFPLLYNICNLYLATNKNDQAKVLCQQWLKANPNEENLWLLYARVEQNAHPSSGQLSGDTELIYNKSLKRANSLRVAYYYAKFLKKQGKICQALIVLIKPLTKLASQIIFQDDRILTLNFQKETDISIADIERAQEAFKHAFSNKLADDTNTKFYLCANHCLFEELCGHFSDLEACYSRAISSTALPYKPYFMCKYLQHKKKRNASFSDLSDFLSKIWLNYPSMSVCETCLCKSCLPAIEDILPPAGFSFPFLSTILNTYITSNKDFFWLNKCFRACFTELPTRELSTLYDHILGLFPLNTELAIEAIKHEISSCNYCKAEAILVSVVRTQPNLLGSLSGKELIRLGYEIHHLLNKK